jgi:hypothetical protein
MPFGDGTGPMGMEPGRRMGYCAGYLTPGNMMNSGVYRGGGRGRRNWFYATGMPGWMRAAQGMPAFGGIINPSATKDEKAMLKEQAEFMKKQIDEIQKRIDQLGSNE